MCARRFKIAFFMSLVMEMHGARYPPPRPPSQPPCSTLGVCDICFWVWTPSKLCTHVPLHFFLHAVRTWIAAETPEKRASVSPVLVCHFLRSQPVCSRNSGRPQRRLHLHDRAVWARVRTGRVPAPWLPSRVVSSLNVSFGIIAHTAPAFFFFTQ